MFLDRKNKLIPRGDYVTADEAIMDPEAEIRSRCESVHDVVSRKVFPLSKALKVYEVTPEQYLGHLLLQNKRVKIIVDALIISTLVQAVLGIIDIPHSDLDNRTKKLVEDMRELSVAG